jgi:hypothetical protein
MHVFNTWLIANLLHPVMVIVCGVFGGYWGWGDELMYGIFHLFIYSVVFSLPCLAVALGILSLIKRAPLEAITKFFVWLFLCASLPAISFIIIMTLFLKDSLLIGGLIFILPATLAVFITILLRFKPFLNYIQSSEQPNQ